jgi:hypothetical protein
MITRAYDFRKRDIKDGGGPLPTLTNFYPGLWFPLPRDRYVDPNLDHSVRLWVQAHQGPSEHIPDVPAPEGPASHRMMVLDLEGIREQMQRPIALSFLRELRKVTHAKCLIIGGAWPGITTHWVWNTERIDRELQNTEFNRMVLNIQEQIDLYREAGMFTVHIAIDRPEDLHAACERARRMGKMLGQFGLERCLWINGHYLDGHAWTEMVAEMFLDCIDTEWDSIAAHQGDTVVAPVFQLLSERLAEHQ